MGSWDWDWDWVNGDWVNGDWMWDEGQYQILGVDPGKFELTPANIQALFHPDDVQMLHEASAGFARGAKSYEAEGWIPACCCWRNLTANPNSPG
jgi:hypothetical protein